MSNDEQENSGFKVTDRRIFNEEGEVRSSTPPEPRAERPAAPERPEQPPVDAGAGPDAQQAPPSIDLASFVLSLATTAVMHMGEGPGQTETTPQNLEASKQMIDILGMLQEKTEGNRTPEETRLLDDILYDLRMKFLTKSNAVQL